VTAVVCVLYVVASEQFVLPAEAQALINESGRIIPEYRLIECGFTILAVCFALAAYFFGVTFPVEHPTTSDSSVGH
jgi:hypothetical protein